MRKHVIAIMLMVALVGCGRDEFTAAARARVEATGDPIIQRIEEFKKTSGRYPTDLTEAGIESPETELGKFRYERYQLDSGEYFRLTAGTFREHGLELGWDSGPGAQRWDIEE